MGFIFPRVAVRYAAPESRDVLILRNPKAGARDSASRTAELRRGLLERQFRAEEFTSIELFAEAARRHALAGSLRAVVSAGGDGTAAVVVDRVPLGTPIALFPLGTENLLSRFVGHSTNPRSTIELVERGAFVRLDAGQANGRLFLLMLGCGFDADVVRRVHRERSGHIVRWNYAKPILQSMRSYDYPELRVYCKGNAVEEDRWSCRWAFVVNLPRYAGGLNLVPHAVGTDGLLDVCTFRRGSAVRGILYGLSVWLGRHLRSSDVKSAAVQSVRIESDLPVPYQLDGDPGGETPVDVQVIPQRLTLLVDPAKGS